MGIVKNRKMVKLIKGQKGDQIVAYIYAINPLKPDMDTDFFISRPGNVPRGPNSVKNDWSLIDPGKKWTVVVGPSRGKTLRALRSYAKLVDSHALLSEIIGGEKIPL